jgi:hypothetical protein
MVAEFEHPQNGHRVRVSRAAAIGMTAAIGPVYFLLHGAWEWAVAYIVAAFAMFAMLDLAGLGFYLLLWLCVMPFAAFGLIGESYRRRGWRQRA